METGRPDHRPAQDKEGCVSPSAKGQEPMAKWRKASLCFRALRLAPWTYRGSTAKISGGGGGGVAAGEGREHSCGAGGAGSAKRRRAREPTGFAAPVC